MEDVHIADNTELAWSQYAARFDFVPDPMILRAGEMCLNGLSGATKLNQDDSAVWWSLQQNLMGISDFFDILVTRERIPLINYRDTFNQPDFLQNSLSIENILKDRVATVEIGGAAYAAIKKGALPRLAELPFERIDNGVANMLHEMRAFGYDWKPELTVKDADETLAAAADRLAALDPQRATLAQFLLGGLVFSGFAQASGTDHYIQPKRARHFLGLTVAPEQLRGLDAGQEQAIFAEAESRFAGTTLRTGRIAALPPVLPYLLHNPGLPRDMTELLDRALAFRTTDIGKHYIAATQDIRADGPGARRTADLSAVERKRAVEILTPYSQPDPAQSVSLHLELNSKDLFGIPGAKLTRDVLLRLPAFIRIWLNDHAPFGGMRKTLRRLWMAEASYQRLGDSLRAVWRAS